MDAAPHLRVKGAVAGARCTVTYLAGTLLYFTFEGYARAKHSTECILGKAGFCRRFLFRAFTYVLYNESIRS